MKLYKICFMVGCFWVASSLLAQDKLELKDAKSTKKLTMQLIQLLEKDDLDGLFSVIKPYWPMQERELDTLLLHTKQQRKLALERFGKSIGTEFIKTQTVGSSLIRYTFLEKFEYHALRWEFAFYNNNNSWVVNAIYWDDDIAQLY